jgi:hypothetical protein
MFDHDVSSKLRDPTTLAKIQERDSPGGSLYRWLQEWRKQPDGVRRASNKTVKGDEWRVQ